MKNTDLDGSKPVPYALRNIKGVGMRVAEIAVNFTDLDPTTRIGRLEDEKIQQLEKAIDKFCDDAPAWAVNREKDPVTGEHHHVLKNELNTVNREDINRMKKISCYKGVRHEKGLKVRGQKTKSNGRTGMELGVEKKLAKAQAQEEAEEEE
ncbi:MAG: 30S ribosomal protein S13 [Candidatus Thermoplasmatota archaeon]|nr:30S ribosomal protein S13 [Candidatus Thermoplasmatota archaeon]